jgi:hypothetical protein
MIGILPGIPPNVAGFKASGEVTREDYEKIVFPVIRKHVETFGHLNFVFYVDTSLKNFSAGAWVRDIWMGLKELARWNKVAIISDVERIRRFTDTISYLLPGEYKGFPTHLLEDAIRWASTEEQEISAAPAAKIPDHIESLLPPQTRGEATQTASEVLTGREEDARYVFERASERLLDVNQWTDLCGSLAAGFQLTDEMGKDLQGHAAVNDFIRIDIPGPGPREGRGYDWVQIEKVEQAVSAVTDGLFFIQVRPSPAPPVRTGAVPAHFLEDSATSTFVLELNGKRVTMTVFGRNEVPNSRLPDNPDKLRNKIVGSVGAIGLSKVQWKALVQGLLHKE